MKKIFYLFLLLAGVLKAQVPDTHTFTLGDVVTEVMPTVNSLRSSFDDSNDANFDASYKGFKDRLSNFRNYAASPTYETETIAYMEALGIENDATVYYSGTYEARTGAQFWEYVDTFVKAEKAAGIWGTFPVYPMLGGTAARCAINLIDPSEYLITWYGSGVFNQFGFTGNGTNAYGSTGFNIASNFDFADNSITAVCGSNTTDTNLDAVLFAAFVDGTKATLLVPKSTTNNLSARHFYILNTAVSNTDAKGVYTLSKTTTLTTKMYKNKTEVSSWNSGGSLPSKNLLIGGLSTGATEGTMYSSGFTKQTIRAISVKTGLTPAQVEAHTDNLNALYTSFGTKTW